MILLARFTRPRPASIDLNRDRAALALALIEVQRHARAMDRAVEQAKTQLTGMTSDGQPA